MIIPAFGLYPPFGVTELEAQRITKALTALKDGIEKKVPSLKLEVINYDLIKNTDVCSGPNNSHEYTRFKKQPNTIICIHCLDKQRIAINYKGSFFDPDGDKDKELE